MGLLYIIALSPLALPTRATVAIRVNWMSAMPLQPFSPLSAGNTGAIWLSHFPGIYALNAHWIGGAIQNIWPTGSQNVGDLRKWVKFQRMKFRRFSSLSLPRCTLQ